MDHEAVDSVLRMMPARGVVHCSGQRGRPDVEERGVFPHQEKAEAGQRGQKRAEAKRSRGVLRG